MQIPAGWAGWTDQQRIAFAESMINHGRRVTHVGEKIRASVEKAQETIENLGSVNVTVSPQEVLQIRNKFVAQNAAEFLAIPDSIPVPE